MKNRNPYYPFTRTVKKTEDPVFNIIDSFLTKAECKSVIELAQRREFVPPGTKDTHRDWPWQCDLTLDKTAKMDYDDISKLYEKTEEAVSLFNTWNFHIDGLHQPLRVCEYKNRERTGLHTDYSDNDNSKLVLICALNDDYAGGMLM